MAFYAGDCAELFDYCSSGIIEAKVKLILQMSLVLIWGMLRQPLLSFHSAV
jgi:3-deoxy-D-arabino-heptulosonate 7-phosphate (DAHP) synthase class II